MSYRISDTSLAIERVVSHSNDPGSEFSVFQCVCLDQITFQPIVLIPDLFPIFKFSGKSYDMRRSQVIAPEVIVYLMASL